MKAKNESSNYVSLLVLLAEGFRHSVTFSHGTVPYQNDGDPFFVVTWVIADDDGGGTITESSYESFEDGALKVLGRLRDMGGSNRFKKK